MTERDINIQDAFEDTLDDLVSQDIEKFKQKKQAPMDADMKFFIEAGFHRGNLNQVRKLLGSKCKQLVHVQQPEYQDPKTGERYKTKRTAYFVKASMVNSTGGKDEVLFRLGVSPEDMTQEDYMGLLEQLQSGEYAK